VPSSTAATREKGRTRRSSSLSAPGGGGVSSGVVTRPEPSDQATQPATLVGLRRKLQPRGGGQRSDLASSEEAACTVVPAGSGSHSARASSWACTQKSQSAHAHHEQWASRATRLQLGSQRRSVTSVGCFDAHARSSGGAAGGAGGGGGGAGGGRGGAGGDGGSGGGGAGGRGEGGGRGSGGGEGAGGGGGGGAGLGGGGGGGGDAGGRGGGEGGEGSAVNGARAQRKGFAVTHGTSFHVPRRASLPRGRGRSSTLPGRLSARVTTGGGRQGRGRGEVGFGLGSR
jgi:hypothetical protein